MLTTGSDGRRQGGERLPGGQLAGESAARLAAMTRLMTRLSKCFVGVLPCCGYTQTRPGEAGGYPHEKVQPRLGFPATI